MTTTTYSTSAAAAIAEVTVDTIRTWARMGAVRAVKVARRWVIDAASLAHRISLGIRRTTKKAKEIVYSAENMIAIGGRRWQRGTMDRVYLNNIHDLMGLELFHYNTGRISGATLNGEGISNNKAYKLGSLIQKVWFDVAESEIYIQGDTHSRDYAEVQDLIVSGIRTRIAAL